MTFHVGAVTHHEGDGVRAELLEADVRDVHVVAQQVCVQQNLRPRHAAVQQNLRPRHAAVQQNLRPRHAAVQQPCDPHTRRAWGSRSQSGFFFNE